MLEEKKVYLKPNEIEDFSAKKLIKNSKRMKIINIFSAVIFFTALFCVAVVSFIIPLRPTFSETENRTLTTFPEFSVTELLKGEYFADIEEWFSDTFPEREAITSLNTRFTNFFGFNDVQIFGEIEQADDIPEVIESAHETIKKEVEPKEKAEQVAIDEKDEANNDASSNTSSESSSDSTSSKADDDSSDSGNITQSLGAIFVNGDSAYEYYYFGQKVADKYASALSDAAELLEGKAMVYDLIVPTSMGIMVPDDLLKNLSTSDQKAAIDYMYSKMSDKVNKIELFDMLKSRKDEYIYFRTDHHWTALGAYYSYCELMNYMGKTPTLLEDYTLHTFNNFLGTFYNKSGQLAQLAKTPDTVYAYEPKATNELKIFNGKSWYSRKVIGDTSGASAGSKYLSFICGDNAFSKIHNPDLDDSSACIVIKESFGNCFVPFLVEHYENVYIVDYRYISEVDGRGLVKMQEDTGATDIIFINNISATRSSSLVNGIADFVR